MSSSSRYNQHRHQSCARTSIVVHDHDVLSGRGVNIAHHPGNERFRSLVTTRADAAYCTGYSASEKRAVAEEIIKHIKDLDPPGRFLKREGRGQVSRGLNGPWEELTDKEAIKKTCQALRDCNRTDREGYASGVAMPQDVAEQARQRVESGLSGKQQAAAAAAASAATKRDWSHMTDNQKPPAAASLSRNASPSAESAAGWLKKQRTTDHTGTSAMGSSSVASVAPAPFSFPIMEPTHSGTTSAPASASNATAPTTVLPVIHTSNPATAPAHSSSPFVTIAPNPALNTKQDPSSSYRASPAPLHPTVNVDYTHSYAHQTAAHMASAPTPLAPLAPAPLAPPPVDDPQSSAGPASFHPFQPQAPTPYSAAPPPATTAPMTTAYRFPPIETPPTTADYAQPVAFAPVPTAPPPSAGPTYAIAPQIMTAPPANATAYPTSYHHQHQPLHHHHHHHHPQHHGHLRTTNSPPLGAPMPYPPPPLGSTATVGSTIPGTTNGVSPSPPPNGVFVPAAPYGVGPSTAQHPPSGTTFAPFAPPVAAPTPPPTAPAPTTYQGLVTAPTQAFYTTNGSSSGVAMAPPPPHTVQPPPSRAPMPTPLVPYPDFHYANLAPSPSQAYHAAMVPPPVAVVTNAASPPVGSHLVTATTGLATTSNRTAQQATTTTSPSAMHPAVYPAGLVPAPASIRTTPDAPDLGELHPVSSESYSTPPAEAATTQVLMDAASAMDDFS